MSDLSPDAQRLIELTREAFSPDAASVSALRNRLDVSLGGAAFGPTSAAAGAALTPETAVTGATGFKLGTIKLLGVVAAITALGFGAARILAPSEPGSRVPQPSAAEHPSAARAPAVGDRDGLADADASRAPGEAGSALDPPPDAASDGLRAAGAPGARTRRPSAARAADDALAREIAALRSARAALDRDQPALALRILARHERQHGPGALQQERLATRVLALCALDRTQQAEASARELQSVAPAAPYLARLRTSCVSHVVK